MNNLNREDFTENRQPEEEAVPFGIQIETAKGTFILNDSISPITALTLSYEDTCWWIESEPLSMFLIELYYDHLTQNDFPVSADYANDDLMSEYSAHDEFCQAQDEFAQRILITADSRVSDFRFSKISFEEQNGEAPIFVDTTLYIRKYLDPEVPLVVCVSFPSSIS